MVSRSVATNTAKALCIVVLAYAEPGPARLVATRRQRRLTACTVPAFRTSPVPDTTCTFARLAVSAQGVRRTAARKRRRARA